MPVALAPSSSSSFLLGMTKPRGSNGTPSRTKTVHYSPSSSMSTSGDSIGMSSRASSMAGRKRPRESDGDSKARLSRRTKSVGDVRSPSRLREPRDRESRDREREAFQRGLLAVFVPNALRESLEGRLEHYNELLAHFLPSPTAPNPALPSLQPLLRGLTAHVSLLSPELHSALVSAILNLPWACGEEKFVKTFIGFAGVLVSAHQSWAKEVVNMAIRGLTWQSTRPSITKIPISRRLFHARHHLLIAHLISLIPTLPSVVHPLVARHFPNKREPTVAQTTWVRNCCELVGYCPELGQRVWGQIVDRLLRIDSEINNILEEEEEDEEEDETEDEMDMPSVSQRSRSVSLDPFELLITQDLPKLPGQPGTEEEDDESDLDPDELSSVDGEDSEDEADTANRVKNAIKIAQDREKKRQTVKAMKEKLDGMLLHFLQHVREYMGGIRPITTPAAEMAAFNLTSSTASSSGASTPTAEYPNPMSSALASLAASRAPLTPAQSLSHFQTLLNLFTRQVLPTSSTQHVPFILFYAASLTQSHTDAFLGLLVSQAIYATSTTTPAAASQPISLSQRVASTVYIASIVCRARFVSDDQTRQITSYLLAYLDSRMHAARLSDAPLFFAMAQAVMLIFCFRWRAFLSDHAGDNVVGEIELDVSDNGDEGKWVKELDVLQRLITSELNPLLGCNPTIVRTFAKVAHQTNFAYCYSIIEANQQYQKPVNSLASTTPGVSSRHNSTSGNTMNTPRQARQTNIEFGFDNYFPFDPYTLPKSKCLVDPLYRTWTDVAIDANISDDESSSDEDDEEEETASVDSMDQVDRPSMPKLKPGSWSDRRRMAFGRDEGLSSSLEGMSISPNVSKAMVGVMGRS